MRAKQSSTADGTYTGFAPPAHPASDFFAQDAGVRQDAGFAGQTQPTPRTSGRELQGRGLQRADRSRQTVPADLRGEGLLHDARNLVSAIGLYCDLLSMPGVLKPEHRQYPEELRLLGTRSRVLIEHLLRSLVSENLSHQYLPDPDQASSPDEHKAEHIAEHAGPQPHPADLSDRRIHGGVHPNFRTRESGARTKPISLRATVERCSGLLSRVANGCPIEVIYGAAADVPVWISEEAIERILVNLVRNACHALDREPRPAPDETEQHSPHTDLRHRRHRRPGTSSLPGSRTAIRISVGPLLDRVGEARSWPFQHVRLLVEDSGCGMSSAQLHSLLSGQMTASRGTHGIGFRVVRELVAASNGDLRASSTPGIGTRVQIEWPVAAISPTEQHGDLMQRKRETGTTLKSPSLERQHRSILAASQPSAATEGRPGVN